MKIYTINSIILTSIVLLFSGCSGKSGDDDINNVAVPSCGEGSDMGKSVAVNVNNKTIQKTKEGAKVRIWHDPSGEKFACMISGEALIVN